MNLIEQQKTNRSASHKLKMAIMHFVFFLLAVGVVVAAWNRFGPNGFDFSVYFFVTLLFVLTRVKSLYAWPINLWRPSMAECAVFYLICVVMHGLAFPGIESNCIGRRQTAEISVVNGPTSQTEP